MILAMAESRSSITGFGAMAVSTGDSSTEGRTRSVRAMVDWSTETARQATSGENVSGEWMSMTTMASRL